MAWPLRPEASSEIKSPLIIVRAVQHADHAIGSIQSVATENPNRRRTLTETSLTLRGQSQLRRSGIRIRDILKSFSATSENRPKSRGSIFAPSGNPTTIIVRISLDSRQRWSHHRPISVAASGPLMTRNRISFLFLNLGHFFDHLFLLVFATVAALSLAKEWNLSYAELIPYATPGFIAFAICSLPAGWLADKWSREGMIAIFFIGIGASSMVTALAETPVQIGAGLLAIGVFAAIYHPVGLAMVVHGRVKTGVPLAINGIFGNMGVACAALITGYLIDQADWRAAFVWPGLVSVLTGVAYMLFVRAGRTEREAERLSGAAARKAAAGHQQLDRRTLLRVLGIVLFTTAAGGLVFQSTTFALPKVFDERLQSLSATATQVGGYAFIVFAVAAFAQLVVGYLVDRHSIRGIFALVAGLQVVFFVLMSQLSGPLALFVAMAFMLVVFGQIPINDVLIGRVTRNEWRSRIYALRYILTCSVMASAVPFIAWLHAGWGFTLLFQILAAAAAAIFFAVLLPPGVSVVTGPRPRAAAAE